MRAVRLLHSAQMTYSAVYGSGNYGTLSSLGQTQVIDPALASGSKYGYVFTVSVTFYTPTSPGDFVVTATPRAYGKTGRMSYFINTIGEIHGADKGGQPANVNDPYIDDCSTGTVLQNERCTVSSMRALHGAELTYSATAGNGNFSDLSALAAMGLITPRLAAGLLRGYSFTVFTVPATPQTPASFYINSVPQTYPTTGVRSFYIDETGILRGADKHGEPANGQDPPVND